jgi:tRNA(Ile)-lysidine synthase
MQVESNSLYTSYLSMRNAISRDEDFLDKYSDEILEEIKLKNGYDVKKLSEEHDSVIVRCVAKIFCENEVPVDTARLDLVLDIVKNGGKITLKPDLYAVVKNSILTIEQHIDQEYFEMPLSFEKELEPVEGKMLLATVKESTCSKNVNQKVLKKYIDYDKIGHDIVVRQRKDGESVRLASNKMTKTLKKLFNEHKISPNSRDKILIISDENGIVWIEGFGTAERCSVDENTKNIITIEVKGRTE